MFSLTIEGAIDNNLWESTPAQFPTDELYSNFENDLEVLQNKYRLRNPLCPDDFRGNDFTNELLMKIVEYSRTVRDTTHEDAVPDIAQSSANTAITRSTYYTYLELYRKVFSKTFINRIRTRYEDIKGKAVGRRKAHLEEVGVRIKGVPLRSFHVLDNSGDSSKAFRIIINYVEAETGSSIAWNHLSTYSSSRDTYDRIEHVKDPSHWTKGVDGDGTSIANIRAWKNKITTILKNVDVIVINDTNDTNDQQIDYTASAIMFVLMNLNASGTAIISLHLSALTTASTISMIHLFAISFDNTDVIHTIAEDRLFLCGSGFKNNVNVRHFPNMITACQTGNSLFNAEYMNGIAFTETVEKLINIMRAASDWRLLQYKKMLEIYEKLSTSESSRLLRGHVEKILEEYYPRRRSFA